ncbi:hypothetical protein ES703_52639 [subsurface metagenome]
MSQRYEYFDGGCSERFPAYSSHWLAQTFVPSISHRINMVKLEVCKWGTPPTVTVGIRATDGEGHPTGSDLCSGTFSPSGLPTCPIGHDPREIPLGAGYDLVADTKYAIVLRTGGNASNYCGWCCQYGGDPYPQGSRETSEDSGLSWTSHANYAHLFEEWFMLTAPTVTTVAADNIEKTTANPKGNVTDTGYENPTRYIDYDTDSGVPYANFKDCGVGGVGVYNSNLTDLIPGTKYYYRARAVNSGGTGTGVEMTFTTKSALENKSANMGSKMVAAGLI